MNYFVVLGAMRTGSNLLQSYLEQYDGLRALGELFNGNFIDRSGQTTYGAYDLKRRDAGPLEFLRHVLGEQPDRVTGFRLFPRHNDVVLDHVLRDPRCRKVILRRNALDSYISLCLARKTDQWLVRGGEPRSATVRFDAEEFDAITATLARFYGTCHRVVRETGQAPFFIDYDELKDTDLINGLAAFLGSPQRRGALKEKIKKQNSKPLRDIVENYDDMMAHLRERQDPLAAAPAGTEKAAPVAAPVVTTAPKAPGGGGKKASLFRGFVCCRTLPFAYYNVAQSGNTAIKNLLYFLDHGVWIDDPDDIHRVVRQDKALIDRGSADYSPASIRDAVSFSCVRDPLERAYACFMEKIFFLGPHAFLKIRQALVEDHGLKLPDAAAVEAYAAGGPEASSYGPEQHADNFAAFLRFVRDNLAGATAIRRDPHWMPQSDILTAAVKADLDWLGDIDDLAEALPDLLRRAGYAAPVAPAGLLARAEPRTPSFLTVRDIMTDTVFERILDAYGKDYAAFGYPVPEAAVRG